MVLQFLIFLLFLNVQYSLLYYIIKGYYIILICVIKYTVFQLVYYIYIYIYIHTHTSYSIELINITFNHRTSIINKSVKIIYIFETYFIICSEHSF